MSGESIEVPSLFHEVRKMINDRLTVLVAEESIREMRHECIGFQDQWFVTLYGDDATELTFNSTAEIVAFLQGFDACDAVTKARAEYDEVTESLRTLVYAGILSSVTALGHASGDWVVYHNGKRLAFANKQEALDFLSWYKAI